MDGIKYRGYVIEACPHQLVENNRWRLETTIERHTGDTVEIQQYSAGDTFESRDEAVKHCLNFGRQIIDGTAPGCHAP